MVQVLTGLWLAQYYNPDPAGARESVIYIQNIATLGDVVRGVHVWAAYLVVITAVLHLLRIVVTAAHKVPREFNWLVGAALLMLLFGAVFTGTVLRGDQEGFEALSHNIELAALFGPVGRFFSEAFTSSVALVPRLYSVHVTLIPLLILALVVMHLFLIKHITAFPPPRHRPMPGSRPTGCCRRNVRPAASRVTFGAWPATVSHCSA